MSLLKYFSRVDPRYHDSQLADPNGQLARAVPSSAISVANKSVNVSLETNKKATTRGVYQKLSAGKNAEIGKRAPEHGVIATVRYYASKLPEPLKESSVRTWKNVYTKEKQRLRKEGKDSTTIEELPSKNLLGDDMEMPYLTALPANGAVVNTVCGGNCTKQRQESSCRQWWSHSID